MNKKIIIALAAVLVVAGCANDGGEPQMKVIVMDDGVAARLVGEDETSYVGDIQDTFTVPKTEARVEVWRASDGKGMVALKEFGEAAIYAEPSAESEVVGKICYEQGYMPDAYRCLGYGDGWFEIEMDSDRRGYVSAELVAWDAIGWD